MNPEYETELSRELNRFYFLIKVFGKTIDAIEEEMNDSSQWFIFCSKIGIKFHTHLTSFVFCVTQDLLNLQIDEISISNKLDISSMYSNLRLQFDTYTTFYHIFIHEGDWSEKIIRFRLWQLDSLITRQTFLNDRVPETAIQIESEKESIKEIMGIISSHDFYCKLTETQKGKLIRYKDNLPSYCNWKFDKSLLTGKKEKYSWEELATNTGIKLEIYSDMHNFTSMHVHSNYISILQNEQMDLSDKHAARMVCLRLSCYLTSLFLDDLCSRFGSAKTTAKTLNNNELDIIKGFLTSGRLKEKIKYFA